MRIEFPGADPKVHNRFYVDGDPGGNNNFVEISTIRGESVFVEYASIPKLIEALQFFEGHGPK